MGSYLTPFFFPLSRVLATAQVHVPDGRWRMAHGATRGGRIHLASPLRWWRTNTKSFSR